MDEKSREVKKSPLPKDNNTDKVISGLIGTLKDLENCSPGQVKETVKKWSHIFNFLIKQFPNEIGSQWEKIISNCKSEAVKQCANAEYYLCRMNHRDSQNDRLLVFKELVFYFNEYAEDEKRNIICDLWMHLYEEYRKSNLEYLNELQFRNTIFLQNLEIQKVLKWIDEKKSHNFQSRYLILSFKLELLRALVYLPDDQCHLKDLVGIKSMLEAIFEELACQSEMKLSNFFINRCRNIVNAINVAFLSNKKADIDAARAMMKQTKDLGGAQEFIASYLQNKLSFWQQINLVFNHVFNSGNKYRSDAKSFFGVPSGGNYYNVIESIFFTFTLLTTVKNCFKFILEFIPAVIEDFFDRKLFLQGQPFHSDIFNLIFFAIFSFIHSVGKCITSPQRSFKEAYYYGSNIHFVLGVMLSLLSLSVSASITALLFIALLPLAPLALVTSIGTLLNIPMISSGMAYLSSFLTGLGLKSILGYAVTSDMVLQAGITGLIVAAVIVPVSAELKWLGKKLYECCQLKPIAGEVQAQSSQNTSLSGSTKSLLPRLDGKPLENKEAKQDLLNKRRQDDPSLTGSGLGLLASQPQPARTAKGFNYSR